MPELELTNEQADRLLARLETLLQEKESTLESEVHAFELRRPSLLQALAHEPERVHTVERYRRDLTQKIENIRNVIAELRMGMGSNAMLAHRNRGSSTNRRRNTRRKNTRRTRRS